MNIQKAQLRNDVYTWDNNITRKEWRKLLLTDRLIKDELKFILYQFYKEKNHQSTCQKIAKKVDKTASEVKDAISNIGKIVQSKLDRFQIIGTDKQPSYWVIPMFGQLTSNALEWVVRPELVQAMKDVYEEGCPSKLRKDANAYATDKSTNHLSKEDTGFADQQYLDLLLLSKNLVFTGVIGSGKTYLAKRLAKEMDAEMEMVRFHPAYTYASFMEGFNASRWKDGRYDDSGVLQDGIFKAFCKKALKNLIDSEKSIAELKEEKMLYEVMTAFIEKIKDDIFAKGEFVLNGIDGQQFASIIDLNKYNFTVTSPSGRDRIVSWGDMLPKYCAYARNRDIEWTRKDIEEKLSFTHDHAYLFLFLKAFDAFLQRNRVAVEVEPVKKKNFVFIIDEINKANVSDVFGDALYAIEAKNRGEVGKVKTQYNTHVPEYELFHDGFFVPENVYLIGTMNDIDNVDKMMDLSTIRKFTWKRLKATDRTSMWDDTIAPYKEEALSRMNAINEKIVSMDGLSELYHIGPAYFLKLNDYGGDFERLWENYLSGILMQNFADQPHHLSILRELKKAYDGDFVFS